MEINPVCTLLSDQVAVRIAAGATEALEAIFWELKWGQE